MYTGLLTVPMTWFSQTRDFGRAYLTEGWARRFLVDLFRSFPVLFVGYSHNDIVMTYLARALPPSEGGAVSRSLATPMVADGRASV